MTQTPDFPTPAGRRGPSAPARALRSLRLEIRAWLEGLLRLLPYSALGNACRNRYWSRRLASRGPVALHPGVSFYGADAISLGAGVSIHENTILNACHGHIRIGDNVLLGPGVLLRAADHLFADPDRPIVAQGHDGGEIVIEDDCWIGGKAVILKDVTSGRGSVIGAGAVVTRDIPPGSVAVGVPARVIGRRGGQNRSRGQCERH